MLEAVKSINPFDLMDVPEPLVYREESIWSMLVPPGFEHCQRTKFKIADGPNCPTTTTLIIPGFGVSVGQLGIDHDLWKDQPHTIMTHQAVNYPTEHAFMLYQYALMLRELNPEQLRIIGISLGGSTAIQLLKYLQQHEPDMFRRCTKVLTLVAPVVGSDLTEHYQEVLGSCRKFASGEIGMKEIKYKGYFWICERLPMLRRDPLEVDTVEQAENVFKYTAQTFDGAEAAGLHDGMFGDLPIVSLGLEKGRDGIAQNTEAHRYSRKGKHVTAILPGPAKHSPRFYSEHKETLAPLILAEAAQ